MAHLDFDRYLVDRSTLTPTDYQSQNTPITKLLLTALLSIVDHNLVRFIDSGICLREIQSFTEYTCDHLSIQAMAGKHNIHVGLCGDKKGILHMANVFAHDDYDTLTEDSYDAIREFINCITGMFAGELAEANVREELLLPSSYKEVTLRSDCLFVIPIHWHTYSLNLIISIDSPIEFIIKEDF